MDDFQTHTGTRGSERPDRALAFGIAIPVAYFGLQLIAAPFYPGYSFLRRDASTLGSPGSIAPWIFNVGTLVVGACELIAAWGFFKVLLRTRRNTALAWAMAAALVSSALGSLNASLHPLPDPRHTDGALALFGSGALLLPVFTALLLWRHRHRPWAIPVLVVEVLVFLVLAPIVSGLVQRIAMMAHTDIAGFQAFLNGYQGLLQRVAVTAVLGPVAFSAWLLRQSRIE